MRLHAFDYFRGIAILFIVAGHSVWTWNVEFFYEKIIVNLISNATVFFVFISGFFFHYVFYKNFTFIHFMKKKLKNVFLPYFILTLCGMIYYAVSSEPFPFLTYLYLGGFKYWYDYIPVTFLYLGTGRIMHAYWYIPFIMLIFIASPIFIWHIRRTLITQLSIISVLLLISVVVHRPYENLSPIHAVIYFLPVYMLGMTCAIKKDNVLKLIENKALALGGIVLLLAIIQVSFYDNYAGFYKKEILSYSNIDLNLLQKIIASFFFLSFLYKYENCELHWLKYLANSSFAIYFIHPWVIWFLGKSLVIYHLKFLPGFIVFLITASLGLSLSLLIAIALKKIFRGYSKMIIGW